MFGTSFSLQHVPIIVRPSILGCSYLADRFSCPNPLGTLATCPDSSCRSFFQKPFKKLFFFVPFQSVSFFYQLALLWPAWSVVCVWSTQSFLCLSQLDQTSLSLQKTFATCSFGCSSSPPVCLPFFIIFHFSTFSVCVHTLLVSSLAILSIY